MALTVIPRSSVEITTVRVQKFPVLARSAVMKCQVTSYDPHRVVVTMFGASVFENDVPCYARLLGWTA